MSFNIFHFLFFLFWLGWDKKSHPFIKKNGGYMMSGELYFSAGDIYGTPAINDTSDTTIPEADDQASVNEDYDTAVSASNSTVSFKKILSVFALIIGLMVIFGGAK